MKKIIKIPCMQYSRVVGYYRPIKYWNTGKKEEYKHRKTYNINKAMEYVYEKDKSI